MNNLLKVYKEIWNDENTRNTYVSIAKNNYGKMWSFFSTNYRSLMSPIGNSYGGFVNGFQIISEIEGKKREKWQRKNNVGQEKEKQHTTNMRESELFYVRDNAYHKTKKGIVFGKMVLSVDLNYEEKRFLCYLLILNGYFNKQPNYIFKQTKFILDELSHQQIKQNFLLKQIYSFVNSINLKKEIFVFLNSFYLYIDTFWYHEHGLNFLSIFFNSKSEEKMELYEYIRCQQHTEKECIISQKFKSGGVYTQRTVEENAWILYVSAKLLSEKNSTFNEFVSNSIKFYKELYGDKIHENKLKDFIYNKVDNIGVFQLIYHKLFETENSNFQSMNNLTEDKVKNMDYIDYTDMSGNDQLNRVTASLKLLAKNKSDFRCCCEACEECKYFTSKKDDRNYLEIHHLIPQVFANDFNVSIEILCNYVPLCPNCHRKIHFAKDEERKHLITFLYNSRKLELSKEHIQINLEDLFKYYGIRKI